MIGVDLWKRSTSQRGDQLKRCELAGTAVPLRQEEPEIGWQPDREAYQREATEPFVHPRGAPARAARHMPRKPPDSWRMSRPQQRAGSQRGPGRCRALDQQRDAGHAQHLRQRKAARDSPDIDKPIAAQRQQHRRHRRNAGTPRDHRHQAQRHHAAQHREQPRGEQPIARPAAAMPPPPRNTAADARRWRAGRARWRRTRRARPASAAPRRR